MKHPGGQSPNTDAQFKVSWQDCTGAAKIVILWYQVTKDAQGKETTKYLGIRFAATNKATDAWTGIEDSNFDNLKAGDVVRGYVYVFDANNNYIAGPVFGPDGTLLAANGAVSNDHMIPN